MLINGKEINNIDEAFNLLTDEQQDHCKRVAKYCETVFKVIVAKDTYVSVPRAQRELIAENTQLAYLSGLYHDIGKILPDGEGNGDHTQRAERIYKELYPDWEKLKGIERKLILDGALDHHERMNGLGGPEGKKEDSVSYMGRLVAIADILDNRAVSTPSEDPISEALDSLKEEEKAGFFDTAFFKAFCASRAKLKKAFIKAMGDDIAIPVTDMWIKRKASRPMELVYKTACKCASSPSDPENLLWFAEMRFLGTTENTLKFKDVRKLVADNKLGGKLGEYFIYELCDAYKRFAACGLKLGAAAMVLPPTYLNTKGLAKQIETILADEGLTKDKLVLIVPDEAIKKKGKTLQKNMQECNENGIKLLEEYAFMGYADVEESTPFESEEQIVRSQLNALAHRAKKEEAWDKELEAEEQAEA